MKYYSEENKAVIKSWCNNPEEGAVNQARNLASLPFLFKHVALMPDTHQGYGMPIGGVIATKNVIIPNAVGVDIGCGMCAIKTTLTDITTDQLKIILSEIRKVIPVGFEKHKKERSDNLMPDVNSSSNSMIDWCSSHDWNEHYNSVVQKQYSKATQQLGTLGGGNHFIEIQRGRENINDVGNIWIMIHSGSRNLGYKVAKHYNKVAQDLCNKWCSNIPEYTGQDGLAFYL